MNKQVQTLQYFAAKRIAIQIYQSQPQELMESYDYWKDLQKKMQNISLPKQILKNIIKDYFTWVHQRTNYVFVYDIAHNLEDIVRNVELTTENESFLFYHSMGSDFDSMILHEQKILVLYCYHSSGHDRRWFRDYAKFEEEPKIVRKVTCLEFPPNFTIFNPTYADTYIFIAYNGRRFPYKVLYTSGLYVTIKEPNIDDIRPIYYTTSNLCSMDASIAPLHM